MPCHAIGRRANPASGSLTGNALGHDGGPHGRSAGSMASNAQTTADATGRVFEACRVPSIAAMRVISKEESVDRRYSGLPLSAELDGSRFAVS